MIVDYSVGHTGSVHDSWAFRSTRTYKEHNRIFGPSEWMWADSAYPSETWSVSPFKKPNGRELSQDQKTFNYYLSKVRLFHYYSVISFSHVCILDSHSC
jgi:DDE superfamily endonuclease